MNKNLIILMIDGGRFDYSQNSKVFNALKNKSVFFSQPITYGPHTIAAMHAVFSGTYGTRTGTNSYWSTFQFKKNQFKTLSEYLQDKNYYTKADVVNKLVIPQQGLDEFLIHNENEDDLTERHKAFLEDMKLKNNSGKNFFLYLQYSNIHTGIVNDVLKIYNNFSSEFFNNPENNKKRYQNLFKNAENYLSEILERINELGLLDNSIILVMADHGTSIGEKIGERAYGAFCYDYTLRTFAYFLVPKIPSLEISQQIRMIDYLPTILELLDIPADCNYELMDGESLLPLFNGEKISEKYAYSETGNPLKEKAPPEEPNTHSIRTSNWKLIYNSHDETKELYNLKEDPNEKINLSGKNLEIEETLWKELIKIKNNH